MIFRSPRRRRRADTSWRWMNSRPTTRKLRDEPQRQCEQYLRVRKIDYIRIPDWIYRLVTSNPKLRKWISQYFKGLPDLMIFRQWSSPYNLALFVELKKKGGQLGQGQEALGRRLNVLVIREFEVFVIVVEKIGTTKKNGENPITKCIQKGTTAPGSIWVASPPSLRETVTLLATPGWRMASVFESTKNANADTPQSLQRRNLQHQKMDQSKATGPRLNHHEECITPLGEPWGFSRRSQ